MAVKTPLWSPDDAGPDLRHYTARMLENPDFEAYTEGLRAKRSALLRQLLGPATDMAGGERLHALRGQIRMLDEILDHPRREAARHHERHTA